MDPDLADILEDFVAEAIEHLGNIESELLLIEEKAVAKTPDLDLINRVFRAIHSIKGSAGFLGLTTVGDLSHSLEGVLDRVRAEQLEPVEGVIEALLAGADRLRELIENAALSNGEDVAGEVERLEAILAALEPEDEEEGEGEEAAKGAPGTEPHAESHAEENTGDDVSTAAPAVVAAAAVDPEPAQAARTEPPEPALPSPEPAIEEPVARGEAYRADSSIRVPVSLLDNLMNLAGELVLGRNQLLQAVTTKNETLLQYVSARLDQVTSDVQESVMQTRMQPIGNAFSRFPRVVRDLSRQLGKRCRIDIEGQDVELDKSLIEAVGDPLTHLVRNSVDHGVEDPEARVRAGKPAEGRILLRAFHEGGKVHVRIRDDGAGIDPEKIRAKALANGLLTPAEAGVLSDRDTLDLIFAPGFSMAEKVSDVSGRGVGMDVVRSNLESIGGSVQIESTVGQGTTITVHIPLTLAILSAIIVSAGSERFAIPQANIRELVRVRSSERHEHIKDVRGAEVLRRRGRLLPVVRLSDVVRATVPITGPPSSSSRAENIVVIDAGVGHFGLIVDAQLDAQEIVAKPLGRHFAGCAEIAGATILGDGCVAMILDAAGIAGRIRQRGSDLPDTTEEPLVEDSADTESVVLFRNGNDDLAVVLGVVRRIELLTADELTLVGGRLTYERRGEVIRVVHLDEHLTVERCAGPEMYWALVVEGSGHEVALLAAHLQDVREISLQLDKESFAEPGVAGAFRFEDRTVRLIDCSHVLEAVYPHVASQASEGRARRVLVVEDSSTFRSILDEFISAAGYDVIACEDGQDAYERLCELDFAVDAIVSDIEMPRLNGFDFARRVRAEERCKDVPLLAVSSLSSQADIDAGFEAGFDAYEIKLDRHSVLRSLSNLLEQRS